MVMGQGERVRLYARGTVLGFKRGKSNQHPNTSLVQIQHVNTSEDANWYMGKKVAYVYKAQTLKKGTLYRAVWGRITRAHGNSGVGGKVRVFLYPSQI